MRKFLLLISFFVLSASFLSAQSGKIATGVVVDEAGEPVIGAVITVKDNPKVKAPTNIDGKFQLSSEWLSKKIIITYIGMKKLETNFTADKKYELVADATELQEVVVTGMQKMDKRLFTGSATKLDGDKAKLDGIADVSRALEGKAAGVTVQSVSATFGTAPKIRVRGATSIYGSSRPLWVVDGVVIEDVVDVSADQLSSGDAVTLISSAIAGLNADDIESFQILKDGSATSIYGARAMAGVVVVTTKKGRSGVSKITYTGEFTTRMKPNYNQFNISNSQEQMGIYKEMEQKGWLELSTLASSTTKGIYGKMYELIDTYNTTNGTYGLVNTEPSKNGYLQLAEFRNTDWFDLLFKDNLTSNHSLSISTGNEKARLYASLSAMNDEGWTLSSNVERYTANANASISATKTLTINILTSGSYRKQKAPGSLSQGVDVVTGEVKRSFDINPFSFAMNASRTLDPDATYTRNYASFNIFNELENNYIDLNIADVKFQGELNWKPIKGLELSGLTAFRYQGTTQDHIITSYSNQAQAYRAGITPENATIRDINPFLYTDPDVENALPETILPEGGIKFRNDYSVRQIDFRGTASYNTAFGGNQQFITSLFAGVESNSIDRNSLHSELWGWDGGNVTNTSYLLFKQKAEENSQYYYDQWTYVRSLAGFASGTFSYEGKYTLNLTGRYEGTNKLGKSRQSRWLPTWNIGLAWNAHEEKFFEKLKPAISHLTLKTSYSLTADRGPAWVSNAEPIFLSYSPWRPTSETKEVGYKEDQIGNSELTYEKKLEFNLGVDIGFLNNRINISPEIYFRDNYDLIGQIYTQGVGGQIAKYANVASMKTGGFELTISTKNIENKDFSWNTDFTLSKTHSEITSLQSRSNVIQLVSGSGYTMEGYPVRALFSIPFLGLNEEGLPTFLNQNGEVTVTDVNFQEFEKLGFLKYEGPTDPTLTGGLGNLLHYKNFRLNVFITYSFGNKVRLDPVFRARYTDMSSMPKEFKNRWTLPGDENYTDIPVIASTRQYESYGSYYLSTAYNAYNYSSARIADGGFIRMKEISLAYDFPKKLISSLKISDAQLKVQGTNLFLLYADKKLNGQDPEFVNSGGVASPIAKQYTLTLRIGI
ncbi:MAG: SusC/RagA family TonB-linked outer membrane protein [Paludibacteraceae bacterium]